MEENLDKALAVDTHIKKIEALCVSRQIRLTQQRKKVLEILLEAGGPVKAYDIMDGMRQTGKRITPATVYRSLDFLLEQGLVHRINALNAYIACADEQHTTQNTLMLVCSSCNATEEVSDEELFSFMSNRLAHTGFVLTCGSVEVQCLCRACSHKQPTR